MGSNFILTSLVEYLKYLEETMVDQYGNFLHKRGTSNHPLHADILQIESSKKIFVLHAR
jgi:hypothetical protein